MRLIGGAGQDRRRLACVHGRQVAEGKHSEEDHGEELLAVDLPHIFLDILFCIFAEHHVSRIRHDTHGGKAQQKGKTVVFREREMGGGKE